MEVSQKIRNAMSTPKGYSVARQLGLCYWLQGTVEFGLSLGEYLIIHDEYLSANQIFTGKVNGVMLNAILIDSQWLHTRYPCGYDFTPHNDLETLFIVQVLGSSTRRLVLEISEDEAIVLREMLKHETWQTSANGLTDDPNIQAVINDVFGGLIERLNYINTPYMDNDCDVFIPTPNTKIDTYLSQMALIVKSSDVVNIIPFANDKKHGEVARRLRALGMVSDIGSIRGVYGQSSKTEWLIMPLVERAFYEKRILGKARIDSYIVCLIYRSKFEDGKGYHIVVNKDLDSKLIVIDDSEGVSFEPCSYEPIKVKEFYTTEEIKSLCEGYWSNSRIPSWLTTFFDIVFDITDDLDEKAVTNVIQMPFVAEKAA